MMRRTLSSIASIANLTGTTLGRQIGLVISGASMSARIYQQIAAIESASPTTAVFGALRAAQLPMLWTSIGLAIAQQGQTSSDLAAMNAVFTQFSTITWGLL